MTIPREAVFEAAEFEARRAKVRAAMAAQDIDTLILHSAPNIYYLCGHHSLNLWDYQCLVMPSEGTPFMVLWQFERGRFEASAVATEVELFATGTDPIEETLGALRKHGRHRDTIGIEAQTRYLVPLLHDRLRAALAPARVVNGSTLVDLVRNVKSPAEIALIRAAARITDRAVRAGFAAIAEGVSDSVVAAEVAAELIRHDSLGFSVYPIISAGYRAGMPHNSNCGKRIARGETVFIECSPSLHWYHAPIMRTAAVGRVSSEIESFASRARETVQAMLDRIRPGVPASEVAEAAKAKIAPIRERILFHEVYGYPVGIGFAPTWGEESGFALLTTNHRPLAPGMVFHIPMTIRLNGKVGVGLSHTVIVTEDGNETLSELPLELHRID
jgi:Xaa-Pro dipeptidase